MDRKPQILTLILIKGQRIAPKFLYQWRYFCSPEVLATFPGGSRANRQGGGMWLLTFVLVVTAEIQSLFLQSTKNDIT